MTIRKILIAAVLLLCHPAFALVNAVETEPGNIVLPATTNGMVSFQPWCGGNCKDKYMRARLTADTKFMLDGKVLRYEDFRRGYAAMRTGKDSYALVSFETDTNTVIEIEISR